MVHNETLTNIFWGAFLIWFGIVAAWLKGDVLTTVNSPLFALGTGALMLLMNLVRSLTRLKLSIITIGLGAILTLFYLIVGMLSRLGFDLSGWVPFLPLLLVISGAALIIGAIRTRDFQP